MFEYTTENGFSIKIFDDKIKIIHREEGKVKVKEAYSIFSLVEKVRLACVNIDENHLMISGMKNGYGFSGESGAQGGMISLSINLPISANDAKSFFEFLGLKEGLTIAGNSKSTTRFDATIMNRFKEIVMKDNDTQTVPPESVVSNVGETVVVTIQNSNVTGLGSP